MESPDDVQRLDGNTVDIDRQMTRLSENALYQMRAITFRWPFPSASRRLDPRSVEQAWTEWRARRTPAAGEVLVQRYVHLVRYVANRLSRALPQSVELDDLVSAGVVGFLAAVEGFDASRGVDFSSYALTRIRGAMVDFMREIDPVGRVTRRRLRAVEGAAVALAQTLGRRPTDEEMATELGMSLDAYHELMARATAAMTLSLDGVEAEGDESEAGLRARVADQSEPDPLERVLDRSRAAGVAEMVTGLSQAQQLVLHLHYVEELNFREIAMVMDISESRATQHHSAAVLALRGRVCAEPPAAESTA